MGNGQVYKCQEGPRRESDSRFSACFQASRIDQVSLEHMREECANSTLQSAGGRVITGQTLTPLCLVDCLIV